MEYNRDNIWAMFIVPQKWGNEKLKSILLRASSDSFIKLTGARVALYVVIAQFCILSNLRRRTIKIIY